MPQNPTIRIMIADDHALFRTGLKLALSIYPNQEFLFIGEAATGKELITLLETEQPDVVLMDVQMPQMNGIEATTIIKNQYPLVRTIALSHSDANSSVMGMIKAGAEGYLLKNAGLDELANAIRKVYSGVPYYTAAATIHLATNLREDKIKSGRKTRLTAREIEILQRICERKRSKEIATALYVSKRTIDSFRQKIMDKAGAKNLMQLLRFDWSNHLINT